MPFRRACLYSVLMMWTCTGAQAQTEESSDETADAYPVDADGDPIDPHHRFSDDLTEQPARFYLWYDDEGWHLRSTTPKNVFKFTGTITVSNGTFGLLRDVGFERRGRYADSARVTADHTRIEFTIFTSTAFDGIEFTVNGADATVTFEDLNIRQRIYRNRIFIGNNGQYPAETTFSFPATP